MSVGDSTQVPAKALDLRERKFERLTVIAYAGQGLVGTDRYRLFWICRCLCGKETTLPSNTLLTGHTRSCGCLDKDTKTKHGQASYKNRTREYRAWMGMKIRCLYRGDHYERYAARGITVCDRWFESFKNFLDDMGLCPPGKTLDRFPNNDGNYEPGNCRWATGEEQVANKSNSLLLTYQGVTRTLGGWARHLGLSRSTLHRRYKMGKSPNQILASSRRGTR